MPPSSPRPSKLDREAQTAAKLLGDSIAQQCSRLHGLLDRLPDVYLRASPFAVFAGRMQLAILEERLRQLLEILVLREPSPQPAAAATSPTVTSSSPA